METLNKTAELVKIIDKSIQGQVITRFYIPLTYNTLYEMVTSLLLISYCWSGVDIDFKEKMDFKDRYYAMVNEPEQQCLLRELMNEHDGWPVKADNIANLVIRLLHHLYCVEWGTHMLTRDDFDKKAKRARAKQNNDTVVS